MLEIYNLKTENSENPMGIDSLQPRFSWKLKCDKQAVVQKNYHVIVSNEGQTVWDSGKIESSNSTVVHYEGIELESCKTYEWKVSVTTVDSQGEEEHIESQSNSFSMGLLKFLMWRAKWIETEQDIDMMMPQPVQYLRKSFRVKRGLKSAQIFQTAHGLYEFWVNGILGTEDKFKPGFTSYYQRLQYQMYDIKDKVIEGENVWSVALADGWWRGITGGDIRNNFGTKVAFLGQIILTYDDGSVEYIITDKEFRKSTGGFIESDMKMGDIYDASKEPIGWKEIDFKDSEWNSVYEVSGKNYLFDNLISTRGNAVREKERFQGESFKDSKGNLVIDFSQNIAGYVAMTLRNLKLGQKITIEYGEDMKEGAFYNENIAHGTPVKGRERFQQVDYIAKGEAEESFCPMFSVFGFQYIRISGYDEEIRPEDFVAIAVYSDCEDTGSFTCSNELINKLVSNSKWSQKGNFLDVPTDCPTRERSPWTGDSQIYAKTAGWFADVNSFYEKWMQDVAAEQCDNGKILNITPNCMMPHDEKQIEMGKKQMEALASQKNEAGEVDPAMAIMQMIYADDGAYIIDGSSGWGDTATISPWVMYLRYGDKTILKNQYESAKKWVEYMMNNAKNSNPLYAEKPWYAEESGEDGKYIWDTKYQWGEWLEPDIENAVMNGADAFMKPDPEVPTAYLCYSSRLVSKMATVLGNTTDAAYYLKYSNKVKAAYNKYLIGENGVIKEGRQAPHVRALAFDICAEENKEAVAKYLNSLVISKGYYLNTGFLSTAELLNVLCDYGYTDTAYKLLLQEECPGWLFNVKAGATTIPETWDAKLTHKESMNHYSYGAVCDFLFSKCCGISWDEEKPGFGHFFIEPHCGNEFQYAIAEYESSYGKIVSSWKRTEKEIEYIFTIPCNSTATIRFKNGRVEELLSGTYKMSERI